MDDSVNNLTHKMTSKFVTNVITDVSLLEARLIFFLSDPMTSFIVRRQSFSSRHVYCKDMCIDKLTADIYADILC